MEVFDSVDEFVAWIDTILSRLNGSEIYATDVWNGAAQQAEFNATHFGLPSETDSLAHLRSWMLSPDSREAELIRNQLRARLVAIRLALTGQGRDSVDPIHRDKLARQWRDLADRFRRIANNDCSEADVKATAAVCGPVLPRMRDAGLIPANLIWEPSAAELQEHARQPDVIARLWAASWANFVIANSHPAINPDFPIPNPLAIKSERRGGPSDMTVGGTNTKDWRTRAENYAAFCDWLADEEVETHGADNGTGNDPLPTGLDRNNIAVLFCLLNRSPALLTLDDITIAAHVSRDTATNALNELIGDGLACRPKGERRGATVTEKGRQVAALIRR